MTVADKYFVIIHDQHGGGIPMTSDEYGQSLTLFDTWDEANKAAHGNAMARACGHDIHQFGESCG